MKTRVLSLTLTEKELTSLQNTGAFYRVYGNQECCFTVPLHEITIHVAITNEFLNEQDGHYFCDRQISQDEYQFYRWSGDVTRLRFCQKCMARVLEMELLS